jgi:nucleotide-binding universal stress UspA family protein
MLQLLLNRHAYDTSPQDSRTTVGEGTTFEEKGTTSVEKGTISAHAARPWEATMNQRVLVVVDPEGDQRLLLWLRRVLGGPPADLHLLSVLRPVSGVVAGERRVAYAHQAEEAARAHTLARLGPAAARLKDEGFRVKTEVRFGDPEATVLRTAAELGASLIALAVREARGWLWWRAGRVERKILRRATVPVLAVRRHGQRVA